MKSKTRDFIIWGVTTIIGMALMFVLLTTKESPVFATIAGITVGFIALVIGLTLTKANLHKRHRSILEYTDSATIPPKAHIDIIFNPPDGIRNPKLMLSSRVHQVEVEEVWHNGVGTLLGTPRALYYWHRGQSYPGHVNYHTSLVIRIFNHSDHSAVVVSKLVGYKEKA